MNPKDHDPITEKDFENCLKIFFVLSGFPIMHNSTLCFPVSITNQNTK